MCSVKWGVIQKIFHFLFGESEDSVTINKNKQYIHLLKENQLKQQEEKRN